ncbi:hypothetical protein DLAC_00587 [Tieghemostelium lacteum]|uniref:Uncharacterized protein n=1 Tax=Tieghemostelium lacteum TaxID=361077 RepID=A0A152AAD1_TIELA|nr:hypothetical protein DLAC_00587 [Tieghemostelium lacteum]|eukprot:KYR03095.1 hypothetical protein DLAC_00587 [Tieghemostelium lacteum]
MNSIYSNKENIKNVSTERLPLQQLKNGSNKNSQNILNISTPGKPVVQQQQQFSSPVVVTQTQQLFELKKKIKELEEALTKSEATVTSQQEIIDILNDSLQHYQDPVSSKQTNNRIRKIQQLTLENASLQDQVHKFELLQQDTKVTAKLTNNRIRTIHKLKGENKELKEENEKLRSQNLKLTHHAQHIHVTTQPTVVSSNPPQPQTVESLHYHQAQVNRSFTFSNDYGINDHDEHVGEC